MTTMSYYQERRKYGPAKMHWPSEKDAQELVQFQNGVGITMDFDDVASVRHPVCFICRDRGVLRLNHRTFYEVKIPGQLLPMVSGVPNVEVVLNYSSGSFTSVFAQVERVLRMPGYLIGDDPDKPRDTQTAGGEGDGISADDDFAAHWALTMPRQAFESMIEKRGGEVICDYERGESKFTLAHDGKIPLLAAFFGDANADWLADEERFNDEPPLWFSENSQRQSPLYAVRLAAKYLERLGFGRIPALVVLSDHITIVNEEEVAGEWKKLGVNICYCSRASDRIVPLERCLDTAPDVDPDLRMPDADEWKKLRQAVVDFDDSKEKI